MDTRRILIVDDEESILSILKNSLKKWGPECQVVTATDGVAALAELRQQFFDLVVTDYRMGGMNGLELLETIRSIQPKTRVVLITAYGSTALEAEAHRLQAYRYLTKPLEINLFRQVVYEALNDLAINRSGILILSDERYRQANKLLEQLKSEVGASHIFLTDSDGQIIVWTKSTDKTTMEGVASLLGGSIATLQEAGRSLDGDVDAINLAYREGKREYLYALNIGQELLLILIIPRTAYSRLGSVWHFARQTALALRQTLGQAEYASPQQIFSETIDQRAFDAELDKLLGVTSDTVSSKPQADSSVEHPPATSETKGVADSRLMSFDDAVAAGLLPRSTIGNQ